MAELAADQTDAAGAVANSEEVARLKGTIWQEVDRLSSPQKAIVLLYYQQGQSCQEIGQVLGMLPTMSFTVLAKLARLCGADMMLTPSLWSSLQVCSMEEELRTSQTLRAPFHNIRRAWPMPAAGMYPGLADVLIQEHGIDFVVPAGGGMLGHPMGYKAGAMAWRQAFDAALSGMSLQEAAQKYPEFGAAS